MSEQLSERTSYRGPSPNGAQSTPPRDLAEMHRQIVRTRAELGDTVEALAGRLDVKARAREYLAATRERIAGSLKSTLATARRYRVPLTITVTAIGTITVVWLVRHRVLCDD